jgi:hypothetical protein
MSPLRSILSSAETISVGGLMMSLFFGSRMPMTSGVPHLSLNRLPPSAIAFVHSSSSLVIQSANGS